MATVKGVPRRGSTTPQWVETRIGELFLQLTMSHRGQEPTGKEVHAALQVALGGEEVIADLPSLRKVQEVLQRTRDGLRRLLAEQRILDTSWSLGSLATHDLPTDSLNDVIEVWTWSLSIGTPLTIREAQWTARIRATLGTDSEDRRHIEDWIGTLYGWAHMYARRERATEALGADNDTRDLDALLVHMSAWEWHTAHLVGVFPPPHIRWENNRRESDKEAVLERDSGHYSPIIGGLPHDAVEHDLGVSGWMVAKHPIAGTSSSWLEMIEPSLEESRVYAYWLRYLSKGLKWDAIPSERQKEIAVHLREEVQTVEAATQQYRDLATEGKIHKMGETEKLWGDVVQVYPALGYSIGPEPGPLPSIPIPTDQFYRQPMPPFFAWKPKDLLKEVGNQE